jgi:hypothetical protein
MENRWRELTTSAMASACRGKEGRLLKSESALANGRCYGRRGGFATHYGHYAHHLFAGLVTRRNPLFYPGLQAGAPANEGAAAQFSVYPV